MDAMDRNGSSQTHETLSASPKNNIDRPRWPFGVQHDQSSSDDDSLEPSDGLSSVSSLSSVEPAEGLLPSTIHPYSRFDACPEPSDNMISWIGKPAIKGSTETSRMMLLTCASIGIAFTWGVEMTYCTPYMLSLGLTKGQASFVWLAGPISGMIVQPVIGAVSDQWTSPWGRRRPFIVAGNVIVVAALLTLGFTSEIVAALLGTDSLNGILAEGEAAVIPHRGYVIALAVLALYVVDFAINAVMSCVRSLVVDTLPMERQQEGAAWSSRMASFGHLIGYAAGAVDLLYWLGPSLGDTQFKQLTVIAAATLVATSALTCWAVTERAMVLPPSTTDENPLTKLRKVIRQIWSTLLTMSPRMQVICWSVFWGWIGWFPFNVYSSTWVGETYFRYDVPADAQATNDALGDMGRIGSYALTAYSAMTVLAAVVLPIIVRSPFDENFTRRPPQRLARFAHLFEKSRPDLLSAWTTGHVVFACAMLLTPFATSFRFATFLVSLCGIPWTVITWAPTAMLGIEVNRLTAAKDASRRPLDARDSSGALEHGLEAKEDGASSSSGELSGVYFGILNVYSTVPQFLGNLMSTCIFAILEPGKSPELAKHADPSEHHKTDGPNAIAVTFFIGAFFALMSARSTRRLKDL